MFAHHSALVQSRSTPWRKSLKTSFFRLEGKRGEKHKSFSWLCWRGWQGSLGEWDLLFPLLQSACLTSPAEWPSCYIAFSPADWMLRVTARCCCVYWHTDLAALPSQDPEQKPSFAVCKCLYVYNISSKGTGFVISTSSTALTSIFRLHACGPGMNALNGLYATI